MAPVEEISALPGRTKKLVPDQVLWEPAAVPLPEETVQKGHVSRPTVGSEQMTHSSTATLLPLLRHWTALPAISFFLTNAMHQREAARRVSAAPTFRPPPRVTLTDAKREAWLASLADAAVPLRKLARTIPQGLTGLTLLDTILTKRVPLPRALWLVKCVGASEVRLLKRKQAQAGAAGSNSSVSTTSTAYSFQHQPHSGSGSGAASFMPTPSSISSASPGSIAQLVEDAPSVPLSCSRPRTVEETWLDDWTDDLLAFIEAQIRNFASLPANQYTAWANRMSYMLDLTAELYYEGLIDRSILLDWVIQSVAAADPRWLPVLLLFVDMLWDALTVPRFLSKLIAAISHHYTTLKEQGHGEATRILHAHTLRLFAKFPDAFVVPKCWPQLSVLLTDIMAVRRVEFPEDIDLEDLPARVHAIKRRNEVFMRLTASVAPQQWENTVRIGKILYAFREPFRFRDLAEQLLTTGCPASEIMSTVFVWMFHRADIVGSYISVALSRFFHARGVNIEELFITFLLSTDLTKSRKHTEPVLLVLSGIVFQGFFKVEEYFRRVIASGVLFFEGSQRDTQLFVIRNLPFLMMQPHLTAQARMLLKDNSPFDKSRVRTAASQFAIVLDGGAEPDMAIDELTRSDKMLLAEEFYLIFRKKYEAGEYTMEPHGLLVSDKYLTAISTVFMFLKILVLVIATAKNRDMFFLAVRLALSKLVYFLALNVLEPLLNVMVARFSGMNYKFPLIMTRRTQEVIRKNVTDPVLYDALSQRFLNPYWAQQQLITEEKLDRPDWSIPVVESSELRDLVHAALNPLNTSTLSDLRHRGDFDDVDQIIIDWVGLNPPMSSILHLLGNACLDILAVDQKLHDDDVLLRMMFDDLPASKYSSFERMHISLARESYTSEAGLDRVLEALRTSSDAQRVTNALLFVFRKTGFDVDHYMDTNVFPDLQRKDELTIEVFAKVSLAELEVDTSDKQHLVATLEVILRKCNAFNIKLCQVAALMLFDGVSPEETVVAVMSALQKGKAKTPAWRSVLIFLCDEAKLRLLDAIINAFLEGGVPHPDVVALSDLFDGLSHSLPQGSNRLNYSCERMWAYIDNLESLSQGGNIDGGFLTKTMTLLVKILVYQHTRIRNSRGLAVHLSSDLHDVVPDVDPHQSSLVIRRALGYFERFSALPAVKENQQASMLITDALYVLDFKEHDEPPPGIRPGPLDHLKTYSRTLDAYTPLDMWPFDLIEDANNGQGLNDLALDLARFETYIERIDPS